MIDYAPFWETLKEKGENWYTMEKKHGVASSTLSRLKNNKDVSTMTINDLCSILDCQPGDIIRYVRSEDDRK